MDMPTNYLFKRGSRYYLRRKIPVDLQQHYQDRKEIVRALGTSDRREAERLVREQSVLLDREFDAIRARPNPPPPVPRTYHVPVKVYDLEAGEDIWTGKTAPVTLNMGAGGLPMTFHPDEAAWMEEGGNIDPDEDTGDPDEEPEPPSPAQVRAVKEARRFNAALLAARVVEAERGILRVRTIPEPTEKLADSAQEAPKPRTARQGSAPPLRTSVRLTAVVDAWAKERQPEPQTVQIADKVVRRFYEHVGPVPVQDMTRTHVLQFKDALLASGQTATNTNKQLTILGTLLGFAVNNGMADTNAAQGVKVAERKNAKATRLPFDLAALQAIFGSPVFAEGIRPGAGAGEAAYWLPLLALFTGARLEELCQLRPEDVYQEVYHDPTTDEQCKAWVLRVTNEGEGQGVKNAGSLRRFPIHAELLARGFVEYAQAHKGKPRIFPVLKPNGRGAESGNWSKWFGKYLRNVCKVDNERMVFHSFRHLFKDLARNAAVSEEVSDAITGHASGKVSRRYGSTTYPLAPLVAGMERIRVVGLTLPQPPSQSR